MRPKSQRDSTGMAFGKVAKAQENAPKTSWWTEAKSRDELSERARAEQSRLRNSRFGLIATPERWSE